DEKNSVVRHTLTFKEGFNEKPVKKEYYNQIGCELKTSPSVFEFKLPTVFDNYQSEEQSPKEEPVNSSDNYPANEPAANEVKEEVNFEDQLLKLRSVSFVLKN